MSLQIIELNNLSKKIFFTNTITYLPFSIYIPLKMFTFCLLYLLEYGHIISLNFHYKRRITAEEQIFVNGSIKNNFRMFQEKKHISDVIK